MARKPFTAPSQFDDISVSESLFVHIRDISLPSLAEILEMSTFVKNLLESPGVFVGTLFRDILAMEPQKQQRRCERIYTIHALQFSADDNTIQNHFPCGIERTSDGIHLPQAHEAVTAMNIVDFVLFLEDYSIRTKKDGLLVRDELRPTLAYVIGGNGQIYVVGARWRDPLKRWFLFAQPFGAISCWSTRYHFAFPICTY
jgi:hypothetical protein